MSQYTQILITSERVITIYSPHDRCIGDIVKLATGDGSGNIYGKVVRDLSKDPKYTANVHDVRCDNNERTVNLGANCYNVQVITFLHCIQST
jgi:hypothetical protein